MKKLTALLLALALCLALAACGGSQTGSAASQDDSAGAVPLPVRETVGTIGTPKSSLSFM